MPLNFFAPHAQYASNRDDDEQHLEFKNLVKAFHQAGIGVALMLYNHTCEGDHRGLIYSFKGLDAAGLDAVVRPSEPLRQLLVRGTRSNFSEGTRTPRW